MSSGPTAHMQEGGAAALTLDTCSARALLSSLVLLPAHGVTCHAA